MLRSFLIGLCFFIAGVDAALAQQSESVDEIELARISESPQASSEASDAEQAVQTEEPVAQDPGAPKTLSGMSILGNEEAPKSLVIVPWKSSEIGDGLGVTDAIDERARPVDKEVFLREINYYELRTGRSNEGS